MGKLESAIDKTVEHQQNMTPRNNSATKKFLFDHVWGLPNQHTRYNSANNKKMQV